MERYLGKPPKMPSLEEQRYERFQARMREEERDSKNGYRDYIVKPIKPYYQSIFVIKPEDLPEGVRQYFRFIQDEWLKVIHEYLDNYSYQVIYGPQDSRPQHVSPEDFPIRVYLLGASTTLQCVGGNHCINCCFEAVNQILTQNTSYYLASLKLIEENDERHLKRLLLTIGKAPPPNEFNHKRLLFK